MAEGGFIEPVSEDFGSDQLFAFDCDSCKVDGTVSEGIAFCVDCKEYLCSSCLTFHKRSKALKSHKLLEGQSIHQASGYASSDTDGAECEFHKDKTVQYFCKSHDQVICDLCWSLDHMSCSDVTDIDKVCSENDWVQQTDLFIDEIRILINGFRSAPQKAQRCLSEATKDKAKWHQEIKHLRELLNTTLETLESEVLEQIQEAETSNDAFVSNVETSSDHAVTLLEGAVTNLMATKSMKQNRLVFVALKKARFQKMAEVMKKIEQDIRRTKDKLEPNQLMYDVFKKLKQLVKLSSKRSASESRVSTADNPLMTVKESSVVKIGEFSVRDTTDSRRCYITGSEFLQNGQLLLTDWGSYKVKLMNENLKLQSHVHLTAAPWDVAVISPQEAVVTLPLGKKLQFVRVVLQVKLTRQINTDRQYWGIAYDNNCKKLYTPSVEAGKIAVLVLDLQGRRESVIRTNVQGQYPRYIAVDNTERLYVSDNGKHFVICTTLEGETLFKYRDGELQRPTSLLVDMDHNVYVCGFYSNNVQVINSAGRRYRTLIKEREGGMECPQSLAYRSKDNTLVIGIESSDNIFAFKLQ